MGPDGCVSQDKIFSGFVYTPVQGGLSAGDIDFNLVIQTGTSDIHGWSFVPEGAWVLGFTLSYDITVAPGNPGLAIVQSKDQMNSGTAGNGITINDVQTGVTPSPLALVSGAAVFSDAYNLQTVHTLSTGTIPAGQNLLSYEQNWLEASTGVPEPATLSLIGGALLGLGMLRRKRFFRQSGV
jgi:hypothetical protein